MTNTVVYWYLIKHDSILVLHKTEGILKNLFLSIKVIKKSILCNNGRNTRKKSLVR